MSDAPAPLCDQNDPAAWSQDALRRQIEGLDALAQVALELAQAITDRFNGDPAFKPAAAALAFSRVARAMRMTGLLQIRLVQALDEARARALGLDAAVSRAEPEPAERRNARLEAMVECRARAERGEEDVVERLATEAAERLDDDDIYGDVMTRPVDELVAQICRDLGLGPDWERTAEQACAVDKIANGAGASPFSRLAQARPPPRAGEVAPGAGGGVDRAPPEELRTG